MNLLILPGDGIGPEIMAAAECVMQAADDRFGLGLKIDHMLVGFDSLEKHGSTFRDEVEQACRLADGVVLGPVDHHAYPTREEGGLNPSGELRIRLDLFANVRPVKTTPGVPHVGRDMDLVIVRENTEGFYADRNMVQGSGEFMPTEDLALAVRKVTAKGSRRIAETAFTLAEGRRRKVAVVTKSNVLRMSDGLFLREAYAAGGAFARVEKEEVLVDAMAALLVREPERFDVIVTTNMFGDILSDEAAELAGSLGLAGSLNLGNEYAVAQAVHGAAPSIAGKGTANPTALIRSCAMLLIWLGEKQDKVEFLQAGAAVHQATDAVLADAANHTADLGGKMSTGAFGEKVAEAISSGETN
jgi:isocitrate/isopropylmalate dehydrogenase